MERPGFAADAREASHRWPVIKLRTWSRRCQCCERAYGLSLRKGASCLELCFGGNAMASFHLGDTVLNEDSKGRRHTMTIFRMGLDEMYQLSYGFLVAALLLGRLYCTLCLNALHCIHRQLSCSHFVRPVQPSHGLNADSDFVSNAFLVLLTLTRKVRETRV